MFVETKLDNRAIVLTPAGVGAIAVMRLLGPGICEFLRAHFSKRVEVGRCVHGMLIDGDRQIDDPVVVLHANEQVADLNLHGGAWVVRSALELAARCGFKVVESAAEISTDAVDCDDEIECEALAHLPRALTELGVRALLAQPGAWRKLTADLNAMNGVRKRETARQILDDQSLRWLLNPPRVAIVGAANVGKSTLANQLFAQERSITADIPGTTRDWVGEIANIDGLPIMLLDTPGIRQTADPIEQQAISQSGCEIARADLVVLVLDSSRPLEPDQLPLFKDYPGAIVVINKSDRPAVWSRENVQVLSNAALSHPQPSPGIPGEGEAAGNLGAISIVATTGEGVDVLRRWVRSFFGGEQFDVNRARWWTERQRTLLQSLML